MRVIIAGSRPPKDIRTNARLLEQWYEEHYPVLEAAIEKSGMGQLIEVIVSGTAEGYDKLGEMWANANGLEIERRPAKWRNAKGELDMGAGMKRNREMAQVSDGAVVCWDGKSAGARNCIVECEKVAKAGGMEMECIWVELVDS